MRGNTLKEVRKYLGFTQLDLARALNISQSAYNKMENGSAPINRKKLMIIAEVLGIDPDQLELPQKGVISNSFIAEPLIPLQKTLKNKQKEENSSLENQLLQEIRSLSSRLDKLEELLAMKVNYPKGVKK